ncbi:inter-alpha-trypsin inhibitor heavy chain H3 isoform X1 [Folsomia candida]|uniref:inter-alpha-trypsin inhibitor heavy chain H3 isoform X1 n=1 Tax=Folsomia candida TaxID=158441 RepID=UPI000B8FF2AD|nr:inter-alpha-trypsin inhibitor heavy chain H3 isoform X1 [Folsomia candida]
MQLSAIYLFNFIVPFVSYLTSCKSSPLSNGDNAFLITGMDTSDRAGVASGHSIASWASPMTPSYRRKRAITTRLISPEIYSVKINSDIKYRYSRTHVSSSVANRDPSASQEITFNVVLPETAFISKFVMEIENKSYVAYVKEKDEAKKVYAHAQRRGQTAGLLEMRNSNTFNVNVNIKAGTEVKFNLTYEELLSRRLGKYEQSINFNPAQARSVKDFQILVTIEESQNITLLRVPNLRNDLDSNLDFHGNNQDAVISQSGNKASISWRPSISDQRNLNAQGLGSGNFVVQYDINRTSTGEILLMEGYFVHFFSPESLPPLRKHVIFVLDISGSMYGRKLKQMKEAQNKILDDMKPDDFLDIVTFSSGVETWSTYGDDIPAKNMDGPSNHYPIPATEENIDLAKTFINSLKVKGNTNIHKATLSSINIAKSSILPENVESMIIFLTDGQPTAGVTDPSIILETIKRENSANFSIPIFSLGFGNDVDFPFLRKLSLQNHAFARKIYEGSDAALQMKGFYNEIASPLLSRVSFKYTNNVTDVTVSEFPTVFNGTEIAVAGRLDPKVVCTLGNSSLVLTEKKILNVDIYGIGRNGVISFKPPEIFCQPIDASITTLNNTVATTSKEDKFLERLWAYLTIQQLIEKDIKGEKNISGTEIETPKQHAIRLALQYGFVTPFTSLVVVKPEINENMTGITNTSSVVEDLASPDESSAGQMLALHQSAPRLMAPNPGPVGGQHRTLQNFDFGPPLVSSGYYSAGFTPFSDTGMDDSFNTGSQSSRSGLRPGIGSATRNRNYKKHSGRVWMGEEIDLGPIIARNKLRLSDIQWIASNPYLDVNGTRFTVADKLTVQLYRRQGSSNACASSVQFGARECVHLKDCVLQPFVNDLKLFKQSYFCPIYSLSTLNTGFIGTCCPPKQSKH